MNAANLRKLAGERFLALLLNRPPSDTRTHDTLRKQAAREIIREQRGVGSTGSTPTTPNSGFELLFQKVWRICQNMAAHADQRTRRIEPSIATAPIVHSDEPHHAYSMMLKDNAVTLPVFSNGGGKQLIPDTEFPNRFGAADDVTSTWRQSCELNNQIRAERDRRSAQLRGQQTRRYVG
jgi:hypothetical protein